MGLKVLPVIWADPAEAGFERLLSYIEAENPVAARKLYRRTIQALDHAAAFPELAPTIPELGRGYRELLAVRPFRVVYRVEAEALRVIAIMRQEHDFDPLRFTAD